MSNHVLCTQASDTEYDDFHSFAVMYDLSDYKLLRMLIQEFIERPNPSSILEYRKKAKE